MPHEREMRLSERMFDLMKEAGGVRGRGRWEREEISIKGENFSSKRWENCKMRNQFKTTSTSKKRWGGEERRERGESFLRESGKRFLCLRVFGLPYQGLYIDQRLQCSFRGLILLLFFFLFLSSSSICTTLI